MRRLITAMLTLALCPIGRADEIHVPADHPTIQAAIDAAVDGDEVVVAPGVYTAGFVLDKPVVVRSVDPLDDDIVAATIVTGPPSSFIATLSAGELAGVTVTGDGAFDSGIRILATSTVTRCVIRGIEGDLGGMLVEAGAPLIVDCTFAENIGELGGAITVFGGSPSILSSSFIGNISDWGGGGVFVLTSGSVAIQACLFVGNFAYDGPVVYVEHGSAPPSLADNTGCGNIPNFVPPVYGQWIDGGGNAFSETCEGDCNANLVPDEEDIANGTSADCNANGIPDECDIASGRSADCNWNGVPDDCDIADGTSLDCDGNGIPDECGADCNGNGIPDACDIADGTSLDCNDNGAPDECENADCNGNGVPDDCDIVEGASADCNANGIPDECEPDCNDNSIPDACDIADGTSDDCNGNGVPDSCELASGVESDCNGNGVLDVCDIANGTSIDCDGNGFPDTCDLADGSAADCNGNGVPDSCDIADGVLNDCNANGVADPCEEDTNGDGIPDDCQPARNLTTNVFYATIQDAIDDAQDGDEIMVMPGFYAYTGPDHLGFAANIAAKSILLRSSDPADPDVVAATMIDGIACGGIGTSATVIDGFTLALGDQFADNALIVSDSSPLVRRCVSVGASGFGLALVHTGATPTFEACRFIGNQLASAAIWAWDDGAEPVLVDTVVCGNTSAQIDGPWIDGGGNTVSTTCPPCLFETDGGAPDPCCPADVDGSGAVDVMDLVAVITAWGSVDDPAADINDDGFVDVGDLTAVIVNWGDCG